MKLHRPALLILAVHATILTLLFPPAVQASPYWGPEEVKAYNQQHPTGVEPVGPPHTAAPFQPGAPRTGPSHFEVYGRIAGFLERMQVRTVGPDFGGIREGEHLTGIIQTDNTSEAIWIWTRYYELTGDDRYRQKIRDAFTYSLVHPAYSEEGGSTQQTGYYRMYNCGWAARAELLYREVYGETTYQQYGDSCASYLAHHTLIRYGGGFYDYVNPPVLSWAMGNLHWVGMRQSKPEWTARAVQEVRDKVKVWVEGEPTLLGNETWAMSGGATVWGMVNSYFQAYPDSVGPWVNRYLPYLDNASNPGDFENAWNGWYALGHRAVGLALPDSVQLAIHLALTDSLVAQDGDGDGGVPAKPPDTDTMDQSWVSSYLGFMGLSDFLPEPAAVFPAGGGAAGLVELYSAPNPFRESTRIALRLAAPADLRVDVIDVAGRRVARLAQGVWPAGSHDLVWQGRRDDGTAVASGIYLVRVGTTGQTTALRIVYIR